MICVLAVSFASPTPCTNISIRNPFKTRSIISVSPCLPETSNPSKELSSSSNSGFDTNARTSRTRRISPVLSVFTYRDKRGYIPSLTARNFAVGESLLPPPGINARCTVVVFSFMSNSECDSNETCVSHLLFRLIVSSLVLLMTILPDCRYDCLLLLL